MGRRPTGVLPRRRRAVHCLRLRRLLAVRARAQPERLGVLLHWPARGVVDRGSPWAPLVAEAKRLTYGAAAISPDDRTLYSLGDHGVSVIETASLHLRTSWAATLLLISLMLSPNGTLLYAATTDTQTRLIQVDSRNGGSSAITGSNQPLAALRAVDTKAFYGEGSSVR